MYNFRKIILLRILFLILVFGSFAYSSRVHRTTATHDCNQVRTRISNFGNLGDRYLEPRMEWPKGTGFIYGFEFIMIAGSEVVDIHGDTVQIISESYSRPGSWDAPEDGSHLWQWNPLAGYFNDNETENPTRSLAISHKPESWPKHWPYDYPGVEGSRDSLWNGEFGAYMRADQESYYVMDDRDNDEFDYWPFTGVADSGDYHTGARRGLGLKVKVRGYQWVAVEAEDILIVRYDIENYSDKDLEKVVFGMYVDVMVGGTSDNPDHASFDDIDDITYTWDHDGIDNRGIAGLGYFGFAFLESPGNSTDGIDNDADGMTDESQSNGIDDDGDWRSWQDMDGDGVWSFGDFIGDDVGSDGIGPEDEGYPGPDDDYTEANGMPDLGEPNFESTDNDESDQIGLTSMITIEVANRSDDKLVWNQMVPSHFSDADQANIALTYGSGYFPLETDETRKFAIACVFGTDYNDIFRNKRTMQRIYDSDYNFSKPPRKPRLSVTAGDKKAILRWDNLAEQSIDPIYKQDFEGYLIYRSTDPTFGDIKTITDAYGSPLLWEPIAQYDLKDGLKGPHPVEISGTGAHFNTGEDTGLKYYYVDEGLENGRTYYYAVCSYDKGYNTDFYARGLSADSLLAPVSPVQCSKIIETNLMGVVTQTDVNTAMVVPNAPPAGYIGGDVSELEHYGNGTGLCAVNVVEPDSVVDGCEYEISFTDDSTDFRRTQTAMIVNTTTNDTLYNDKFDAYTVGSEIFNGLQFEIESPDTAYVTDHGWTKGNCDLTTTVTATSEDQSVCKRLPYDIEIRVFEDFADTTWHGLQFFRYPVNFQVWNVTLNEKMDFLFTETLGKDSVLNMGDKIEPIINTVGASKEYTWTITFQVDSSMLGSETPMYIPPSDGDIYRINVAKPFNSDDVFYFNSTGSVVEEKEARSDLNDIYVVPDPYVVTASWEKPLTYTSGRGERRIDFVNLPNNCTIKIFTMSGNLVKTIKHNGAIASAAGSESWDLNTEDGLPVSFGVYIYHVEAPGIGNKIGKFAIIK